MNKPIRLLQKSGEFWLNTIGQSKCPKDQVNTRGQTQLANPTYQVYTSRTQTLFQSSCQHSWKTQSASQTTPKTWSTLVTHNQTVPTTVSWTDAIRWQIVSKTWSTLITHNQTVPTTRSYTIMRQIAPKTWSKLVTHNQTVPTTRSTPVTPFQRPSQHW